MAVASIAAVTGTAESSSRKTSPPIDGRKREIGADREIDAARQDDQLLPDGDDRNDRRLRENVADVDRLQKIGGQLADRRDQNDEDQERTDAQKPERQRNRKSRSLASVEGGGGS